MDVNITDIHVLTLDRGRPSMDQCVWYALVLV